MPDSMATPIRCVPDLLNQDDLTMNPDGFSYNVQIRFVFTEGLDGDKIEMQDNVLLTSNLLPDVATAMSGSSSIPINTTPSDMGSQRMDMPGVFSLYDPSGADFKQGLYGTAPPGPAIVLAFGSGDAAAPGGLPSGGMTHICFDPAKVTDVAGNGIGDPKCVDIKIKNFGLVMTSPADGDSVAQDALTMITIQLSAPVSSSISASDIALTFNGTVVPTVCYTIMADPADASGATIDVVPTGTPPCPATPPTGPASFTVKGTIADQYGVPKGSDDTISFTVTPGGVMPDAGSDAEGP